MQRGPQIHFVAWRGLSERFQNLEVEIGAHGVGQGDHEFGAGRASASHQCPHHGDRTWDADHGREFARASAKTRHCEPVAVRAFEMIHRHPSGQLARDQLRMIEGGNHPLARLNLDQVHRDLAAHLAGGIVQRAEEARYAIFHGAALAPGRPIQARIKSRRPAQARARVGGGEGKDFHFGQPLQQLP